MFQRNAAGSSSNLNWGSSHWVIQLHCKVRWGCQFILSALQPLPESHTHTQPHRLNVICTCCETGCIGACTPCTTVCNQTWVMPHVSINLSFYPPGVNDVLLTASSSIAVEDEVTISTKELTIGGRLHGHLVTVLNTPNLKAKRQTCFAASLPRFLSLQIF